jgi:hypothetical protein
MSLLRCKTCVLPQTRPDTPFIDGECAACVSYKRRPTINWEERHGMLLDLLEKHNGKVIVPSSGGKDSTAQAITLKELGADVTAITARTCHLSVIGRENIDNLARHVRTIEVVPNMIVRARLNNLALQLVGDISWPEHASIFSVPFKMANALNIKLLFFGENPQDQYGGPVGTEKAMKMTRRWVTEFGGFLGLRPADFAEMDGITEKDMEDYTPPTGTDAEAHFLGQYIPWDSRHNAEVAAAAGMKRQLPSQANWWTAENLDNAQTGVHDYFMFLKYGFGRGCQQISVDVRSGHITRDRALAWVETNDHVFPARYAGVSFEEVLERIGMSRQEFHACCDRFTDRSVHAG